MSETTKSVLDWMKKQPGAAVPEGGYAKAAPEPPRIPVRPLSGSVDEVLNESQVHDRAQAWNSRRSDPEQIREWRERIAAAPAKIAAAKERGAEPAAIKKAEATLAELQDRLNDAVLAEFRWYILHAACMIMADMGPKSALAEVFTEAGGTLTFDVPGVLTFRADLTSYEEIPF